MKTHFLLLLISTSTMVFATEPTIKTQDAPLYVGQTVVACGNIVQIVKRPSVSYLNFDQSYPSQTLSAVIWPDMLPNIEKQHGKLEAMRGQSYCVRGMVSEYKNSLQIKISNSNYLIQQ